jgi:hypothetical protein
VRFQTPKPHKPATSRAEHPQNRTKLPPRPTTPPSRARSGIPVRPHFTKWHSRAISDPKTAQTCHLAGRSTPENARNCHLDPQPRHPRHEVAFPCGPTSRSGTPVRFQTPKPHKPATSRAGHPQNRTKLPPRRRGTPENARNCHLDPKTDDAGAPFGSVGWRLPDTEEFSVVRWWLSPHLLEVNGSGSGNRHPVQGGAGRGNQPRPRATAEAPRHHRGPAPQPRPRATAETAQAQPISEVLGRNPARQKRHPTTHGAPSPNRTHPTPRTRSRTRRTPTEPGPAPTPRTQRQGNLRGIGSLCQGRPTWRDEGTACGVPFKIR